MILSVHRKKKDGLAAAHSHDVDVGAVFFVLEVCVLALTDVRWCRHSRRTA